MFECSWAVRFARPRVQFIDQAKAYIVIRGLKQPTPQRRIVIARRRRR